MMKQWIKASKFAEQINCILPAFERKGILDYDSLQNAPRIVGHVCGVDIYQLVAELNYVITNWDELQPKKSPKRTKQVDEDATDNVQEENKQ